MLTETETLQPAYAEPVTELVQASTGKRFANYIIDLIFFYLIFVFWGVIIAIISPATLDSFEDDPSPFGSFSDRLFSMIAYAVIMSLIEGIFRGKSIGKLITGTKAINADGTDISFAKAFGRGFTRAVPFDAFSALGSPSYPWHDKWTDTYVIDEIQTRRVNQQFKNN
jgi:uncharacterized RDD family membrane protein YckC